MPSSRKSRAAKPARPAADATCRKSRTVTRRKVQLDVWTCSAPQPGEPLDRDLPAVKMAPIVWRVGRRNWRLWYISGAEAESGYAPASQPGWYFRAVNPDPAWISNDPVGPYRSFKDALDDLIQGELASGGY
jgi:hypothetical protein